MRKGRGGILHAGPGESAYLRYDARIADQAAAWQRERATTPANNDQPWVLFTSFVNPHPPFTAPADLYARYPVEAMPLPVAWKEAAWPEQPALAYYGAFKYIDYLNEPPQLFDLINDPEERVNLASSPAHQSTLAHYAA